MIKGCELSNHFLSWWKFSIRLSPRDNVYLNFVCIYKTRKHNSLSWWISRIAYFSWINWVLVCIRIHGHWVSVEMLLYLIAWKNWDDDVTILTEVDSLQQRFETMPTTIGCLDPPLGNTRLQTVRLIAALVLTNTHTVNVELANLGTIKVLLVSTMEMLFIFVMIYGDFWKWSKCLLKFKWNWRGH